MIEPDKPTLSDDSVVYYYNRERRLQNASNEVQALHNGSLTMQRGILRVLVSSKRNRYLFTSIVILCVVVIIKSFASWVSPGYVLGNATLTHKMFVYENNCYVDIQLVPIKNKKCTVDSCVIAFEFLDENDKILNSSLVTEQCQENGCQVKHKMLLPNGTQYLSITIKYDDNVLTVTEHFDVKGN